MGQLSLSEISICKWSNNYCLQQQTNQLFDLTLKIRVLLLVTVTIFCNSLLKDIVQLCWDMLDRAVA